MVWYWWILVIAAVVIIGLCIVLICKLYVCRKNETYSEVRRYDVERIPDRTIIPNSHYISRVQTKSINHGRDERKIISVQREGNLYTVETNAKRNTATAVSYTHLTLPTNREV